MLKTPLRSTRLIVEEAKEEFVRAGLEFPEEAEVTLCGYPVSVKIGDPPMTGWEIIAGLPLEEQRSMMYDQVPSFIREYKDQTMLNSINQFEAIIFSLTMMYTWNGESWEEEE